MENQLYQLKYVGWNNVFIPQINTAVEVKEWMSNFLPYFTGHVIIFAGLKVNRCW